MEYLLHISYNARYPLKTPTLTYRIQVNGDKLCSSHKRSVKTHEKNFNDVAKGIDELMKQDCLVETLSNGRSVLHSQFEKLKESYNNYVSVVSEDVSKTFSTELDVHTLRYNLLGKTIDKYITPKRKNVLSKRTPFRMEKMPLPKCGGSIRSYLNQFRKDFYELVLPSVCEKESSYILRQCLSRDVHDYLGSCTSDVKKMFDRLDLKYGDLSKIVECIVSDIRRFKRPENEDYENNRPVCRLSGDRIP